MTPKDEPRYLDSSIATIAHSGLGSAPPCCAVNFPDTPIPGRETPAYRAVLCLHLQLTPSGTVTTALTRARRFLIYIADRVIAAVG